MPHRKNQKTIREGKEKRQLHIDLETKGRVFVGKKKKRELVL